MRIHSIIATAALVLSTCAVNAQENELALGKSSYHARCALCHGIDGKGGGEIAELFKVAPSNLTELAKRSGGSFPFVQVYYTLAQGMQKPGHGDAEMPIWGDYFVSDSLEDRGVTPGDAISIAAGRIMALTLYLESIQQ